MTKTKFMMVALLVFLTFDVQAEKRKSKRRPSSKRGFSSSPLSRIPRRSSSRPSPRSLSGGAFDASQMRRRPFPAGPLHDTRFPSSRVPGDVRPRDVTKLPNINPNDLVALPHPVNPNRNPNAPADARPIGAAAAEDDARFLSIAAADPDLTTCKPGLPNSALSDQLGKTVQDQERAFPPRITQNNPEMTGVLEFRHTGKNFSIDLRSALPGTFQNFFAQRIEIFQSPGSNVQIAKIRINLDRTSNQNPTVNTWFGDIYVRLGVSAQDSCPIGAHQLSASHPQLLAAGYPVSELQRSIPGGQTANGSARTNCLSNALGLLPEQFNSNIVFSDLIRQTPGCGSNTTQRFRTQFFRAPKIPPANNRQPI